MFGYLFDINSAKIDLYKSGVDPTKEVGDEAIKNSTVQLTSDEKRLNDAKFYIVAVPTPVNTDHTPDLFPVIRSPRSSAETSLRAVSFIKQ